MGGIQKLKMINASQKDGYTLKVSTAAAYTNDIEASPSKVKIQILQEFKDNAFLIGYCNLADFPCKDSARAMKQSGVRGILNKSNFNFLS